MPMKIQPVVSTDSICNKESGLASVHSSMAQTNASIVLEDHHSSMKNEIAKKQSHRCSGCFSVQVFIIMAITILLMTCSCLVWLTSFLSTKQALNDLTKDLMISAGRNVLTYVDSQIRPIIAATQTVADDYNIGLVPKFPSFPYLHTKFNAFNPYGIGLIFSDELHTFNLFGVPPNEVLSYYYKPVDEYVLYTMSVNASNGAITGQLKVTPNYDIVKQSYWVYSFEQFPKLKTEHVIGEPYYVPGGGYTIYCCVKLYDPTEYAKGNKRVVGVAKTNLSLNLIQKFLAGLKILGSGFVLVSQTDNDLVIGGSINTRADDGISRVSIYDLKDQNAGDLMKNIQSVYGSLARAPGFISLSSNGVDYYVLKLEYTLANLVWAVFVVVPKGEIELATNISTGVTVAVAVVVTIIGILIAIFIGYTTTAPLRHLEKQFSKIKTMDFEHLEFISSVFKEVDKIFVYLHDMVVWLNEIKTFVPESVFVQLKNYSKDHNPQHPTSTNLITPAEQSDIGSVNYSMSSISSLLIGQKKGNTLFKMGLSARNSAVVRIWLSNFVAKNSSHEITSVFAKISSGLCAIAKAVQADFQALSVDEYQLTLSPESTSNTTNSKKSVQVQALEAALKFAKVVSNINDTSDVAKIKCRIGVSSGQTYAGNLGCSSFRSFFVVGGLPENAKKMSRLADILGCKILTDSTTLDDETVKQFVVRPVERLLLYPSIHNELNAEPVISTVYEVTKEKVVDESEWMYELQAQEHHQQIEEFDSMFVLGKNYEYLAEYALFDVIKASVSQLEEHLILHTNDRIASRLLKIMRILYQYAKDDQNAVSLHRLLTHYHSRLEYSLNEVFPSISDLESAGPKR
ncbi:hypothetical protein C9374_014481 [Naegleria lovaniensis]|uniref:Guanylate cyclase domain-containing protein n=1 Tax=Naegleria lovaniensis TaxID=51637 RepID=A0AA88KPX4_NAELO|nr:uncharacterized protein C9374_014481 [Naegleria lovaniensis]KAG2389081.1 hypothetical protein C9374_014481 [Naegleria lovaniensis]